MSVDRELFHNLEAIILDPEIQRVFDLISEYNQLLQSQPISKEEFETIVREVDVGWAHLIGHEAVFTGRAMFPLEHETPIESYYESQGVKFNGVIAQILPTDESSEQEEYFCQLKLSLFTEVITKQAERLVMHGTADVSDVVELEVSGHMSVERARRLLECYYPDIIDDIDVAVCNSITPDAASIVMNLKDHDWSLGSLQDAIDGTEIARVKRAFEVYMGNLFKFDSVVGYAIVIEGATWLKKGNNYIGASVSAKAIATDTSLQLEDGPEDESALTMRPHLCAKLHSEDEEIGALGVLVPVDSLKSIESIRSRYFERINSSER